MNLTLTDTQKCLDKEFLSRARKITEGYDKKWGSWSNDSQLLHIISEVAEVKDVLRNKNLKYGEGDIWREKLYDEIADIFLTSISLVNILKVSDDDLNEAIIKKLGIVEKRLEALN